MQTQYPAQFVRKDKPQIISSTTTIKMLENYEAWHGGGQGDGMKERLGDSLQMADHIQNPNIQAMAIKTANATRVFWSMMVAYINDECALLLSFKLKPAHIMLLLSNQIVQICDDILEAWGNAASVIWTTRALWLRDMHGCPFKPTRS
jgi:hypothetical protein